MNHLTPSQLQLYADGGSDLAELLTIERHLSQCRSCEEQLAELRLLIDELAADPELILPDTFAGEIAEMVGARRPRAFQLAGLVSLAIGCCLLLGLALFLSTRLPQSEQTAGEVAGTVSLLLGSPFEADPTLIGVLSLVAIFGSLLAFPLLTRHKPHTSVHFASGASQDLRP